MSKCGDPKCAPKQLLNDALNAVRSRAATYADWIDGGAVSVSIYLECPAAALYLSDGESTNQTMLSDTRRLVKDKGMFASKGGTTVPCDERARGKAQYVLALFLADKNVRTKEEVRLYGDAECEIPQIFRGSKYCPELGGAIIMVYRESRFLRRRTPWFRILVGVDHAGNGNLDRALTYNVRNAVVTALGKRFEAEEYYV